MQRRHCQYSGHHSPQTLVLANHSHKGWRCIQFKNFTRSQFVYAFTRSLAPNHRLHESIAFFLLVKRRGLILPGAVPQSVVDVELSGACQVILSGKSEHKVQVIFTIMFVPTDVRLCQSSARWTRAAHHLASTVSLQTSCFVNFHMPRLLLKTSSPLTRLDLIRRRLCSHSYVQSNLIFFRVRSVTSSE